MSTPLVTPLLLLSELQLEMTQGQTATETTRHRNLIVSASSRLQAWCNRRFDYYTATKRYSAIPFSRGGDVDGFELVLDTDLRSITTLTNGDSTAISSENYLLMPLNADAKKRIRLSPTSGSVWFYTNDPVGAISVAGQWGYGGGWASSGAVLSGDINDAVTTVAVDDGTLFEVGMVIRIDSEFMYVSAIETNNLTVSRAYNGSTAASHTGAVAISYWQADPLVRELVSFLVLWHIERVKGRLAGQAFLGDAGLPLAVSSAPREVQDGIRNGKLKWKPRMVAV